MSSQPTGWQTPRTNWKSADVPLPTDLNRIEGNIQAIESGSRTLDPSQVPSGDSGSLRQILSWFANRLKAITGASNWYDAPATTLAAAKSHIDATSGIHGATSSATANRLVIRDGSGRAKFAQGASTGDAVVYPVPVTSLKRAQGTMSGSSVGNVFAVHQYAFASPLRGSRTSGDAVSVGIILGAQDYDQSSTRQWVGMMGRENYRWGDFAHSLYATSPSVSVTWDYLTASGHPRVWAALDDLGEIVAVWEAEDPADPEWPDEPPFEPEEGLVLIQVEPPDEKLLGAVAERLERAPMPQGFTRSIYAADQPPRALRAMFARQLQERGLEEPPDIREVLSIADRDRKYWYLQLYMRQASRLLHDHRASTLVPLYREMCRVDRRTGRLVLR